jgi:magnesium transporter
MKMKESEQSTESSAQTSFRASNLTNGGALELSQKRWFCMSLDSSNKARRQEAESPEPFLEVINRSVVSWVDYITDDPVKDLSVVAAQLGFSDLFVSYLSGGSQLNYQDFDTELFMRLPSIQIRGTEVKAHPLLILIKKNIVFTVHMRLVDKRFIRLRRYSEAILKRIPVDAPSDDKLTLLVSRIIDANNDSNFRHLRVIEEFGDELNKDLMDPHTDKAQLGPKIYEMKHALIIYMNGLWESVDVLQAIRYGDAELLTDDDKLLNLISIMVDQVKSQLGLSEHMSEVLASGIEATQAIYNNQLTIANNQLTISNNQLTKLNNRFAMLAAYLAIVGTALLIPNTIATMLGNAVWVYGPEDLGSYLLLIIGATIGGSILMWVWINKRGLLPKDQECENQQ